VEGSRVLITGASSGLGFELARVCAQDRKNLLLVARDPQRLERAATELRTTGVTVDVFSQDLGQPGAAAAVFAETQRRNVVIDILVNNAGFAYSGPFSEQDQDELESMVQTNVAALTLLSRSFLPDMIARRGGRILNVASTAAFLPGPLMAVYYATKAYVLWFTEALAVELAGTGVTATVVCPGVMMTGFQARAHIHERAPMLHSPMVMDAARVAAIAYRAMKTGKTVCVPGTLNALGAFASVHSPRSLSARIVKDLHGPSQGKMRSRR